MKQQTLFWNNRERGHRQTDKNGRENENGRKEEVHGDQFDIPSKSEWRKLAIKRLLHLSFMTKKTNR
jgi:hypothetical protein